MRNKNYEHYMLSFTARINISNLMQNVNTKRIHAMQLKATLLYTGCANSVS